MRVTAPAKVNLHLAVGLLRDDGYHDLAGVFHTLELADEVTLEPYGVLDVVCDTDIGAAPQLNLAFLAAESMGREFEREPLVRIGVSKSIPHGAGLGGGSADAAAVVAGLAAVWGVSATDERCLRAASSVGADVPFFLVSGGAALMTGRGDQVTRSLPALAGVPVALVRPMQPVSTAAAYSAFDADPVAGTGPEKVVAALDAGDAAALGAALFNNLEAASASVVPTVADALAWTRSARGVLGATVAGSGSAVFAIVESDEAAKSIQGAALRKGWWGAATRLGACGVTVHDDTRGKK